MEKSTATSNNHSEQSNSTPQHDLNQQNETDQQQPPQYENRDYSSSSNNRPTTPAPAYQGPQDKYAVPQGQSQQKFQSLPIQNLQSQSAPVVCPSCGVRAMTITTTESGGMMHSIAALACFTSCLGCIPYLIGSLKDVHHQCGNCNMPLADYHRSGHTEVRCFQK